MGEEHQTADGGIFRYCGKDLEGRRRVHPCTVEASTVSDSPATIDTECRNRIKRFNVLEPPMRSGHFGVIIRWRRVSSMRS